MSRNVANHVMLPTPHRLLLWARVAVSRPCGPSGSQVSAFLRACRLWRRRLKTLEQFGRFVVAPIEHRSPLVEAFGENEAAAGAEVPATAGL
jgi:hypothetical protein